MNKDVIERAGFLMSEEGIKHLLRDDCTCCKDHNRYLEVEPLLLENISSISLDISIGRYFWEFRDKEVVCFDSEKHDVKGFLNKYTRRHDLLSSRMNGKLIIHKDQFFLLEVLELIKFNRHVTGHVLGKSSIARLGLIIQTASIINPMFGQDIKGQRLILEIKNISPITLVFKYGTPIAQVQFYYFPKPIGKHYQQYGMFK